MAVKTKKGFVLFQHVVLRLKDFLTLKGASINGEVREKSEIVLIWVHLETGR